MAPTLTVNQRVLITAIATIAGSIAGLALPPGTPDWARLAPPVAALISSQLTAFLHETPEEQATTLEGLQAALPYLQDFVNLPVDQQKGLIAFLLRAGSSVVTKTTTTTETVTPAPAPATT